MTSQTPRLLVLQQSRNAQTSDSWNHFAEHRQQVMELLRPDTGAAAARLCLLGAGNCNDVDLKRLTAQYAQIDLVDWDEASLTKGVQRQIGSSSERVVVHGGLDLTSVAGDLSRWRPETPPDDRQISELCQRAAAASLPARIALVDTAASVCVLSQLVEFCSVALGPSHPRLNDLIQAVRLGHLRQLAGCLRPGGKAVLITDLVSSDTAADLARISAAGLPGLLFRLLNEGNFFMGLHPQALQEDFRTAASLGGQAVGCQVTPPWLWSIGPRRYAVFALVLRSPPLAN